MKDRIKAYFTFSKKELNGILVLFLILAVTLTLPCFLKRYDKTEVYDFNDFRNEIALFKASALKSKSYKKGPKYADKTADIPQAFNFDPNGLPEAQWQQLGLSDRQIRVIKNFEAKGGRFYRKTDLKKIYSISIGQYNRLEPYIQIADRPAYTRNTALESGPVLERVELNAADSTDLEALPGIGPVLASRIIRFRNRLGGFYAREQLREVYGMDSLKFRKISTRVGVDASLINKIEINAVSFEQLKQHPYLNYKQINAVLRYREQHGTYLSVNDLKGVILLDDETIRKIEPYLSF